MRIVYVLTSLGMGGAERVVLALGERMAARGHLLAVVVLRPHLAEQWPTRLAVFHLEMRKTPVSVAMGLARGLEFLRNFRPDVVHSHGFHGNMVARLMRLVGAARAPISTIHNVYEGGWARMLAYRATDRLCVLTTAVSGAAAARFVRLKAVPAEKCVVVANGIDVSEFTPGEERRAQVRREMKVEGEFVWLAAGRIVPAKDYPNLLSAFALAKASFADAQLWIAGEGGAAEITRMKALTAELGLSDSVRWLGLRRDLPALLDAADGFVLASAWEGMPLVVGEAMAMEKIVAATDAGGTSELVGDAGLLVPAKNSSALAEAMFGAMRMRADERKALGRAARGRICASFSIDAKADEWERLYERVMRREN